MRAKEIVYIKVIVASGVTHVRDEITYYGEYANEDEARKHLRKHGCKMLVPNENEWEISSVLRGGEKNVYAQVKTLKLEPRNKLPHGT